MIKVDIRSLLYEDELAVEAVTKLIDQKYEIKKAKMKKVNDKCLTGLTP